MWASKSKWIIVSGNKRVIKEEIKAVSMTEYENKHSVFGKGEEETCSNLKIAYN